MRVRAGFVRRLVELCHYFCTDRLNTIAVITTLITVIVHTHAFAACTSPSGPAGVIVYNSDNNVLQWCDGTTWIGFPTASSSTPGVTYSPLSISAESNSGLREFGTGVAISGDRLIIGDPYDVNTGTAYIKDKSDGSTLFTLVGSIGNGDFGYSVAIDGNRAVIGDPIGNGEAYIYDVDSGSLLDTLFEVGYGTQFGFSVDISGNYAVVGKPLQDIGFGGSYTQAGGIHIYSVSSGALLRSIENPIQQSYYRFGYSVDVEGTKVAVGSPYYPNNGKKGRAYIYDVTNGNLLQTIENPYPNNNDLFGNSVALSSTRLVVGAYWDESDGTTGISNAGRAYVFDPSTGDLLFELDNPFPNANDYFGYSVAIGSSKIFVGATGDAADGDSGTSATGRVYVYDASNGGYLGALSNPTPNTGDNYGYAVAVDGDDVLVGAPVDQYYGDSGNNSGRAYLYSLAGPFISCSNGNNAGEIIYNSDYSVLQWCDGTGWIGLESSSLATPACSIAGDVVYNEDYAVMQWCDGTRWNAFRKTPKKVFVSSSNGKGNWKGGVLADYDAECQTLADAQSLSGTFKAWISNSTEAAQDRLLKNYFGRYELVDGTVVADGWVDLTDGTLDNPINLDETGVTYSGPVWTGTTSSGISDDDFCASTSDWGSGGGGAGSTGEGGGGDTGLSTETNSDWTAVSGAAGNYKCGSSLPIYCFEQ